MKPLPRSFYLREDVVLIARDLLGKVIVSTIGGQTTAGIITETEAYNGIIDRASHAFGGRRTQRNEQMYALGGTAYVYLCYGIHHLFNVVTHQAEVPHAVLVRGIVPMQGADLMRERRGGILRTNGPGMVSQALGIRTTHNGMDLCSGAVRIEDHGIVAPEDRVVRGPRIGVDYAGPDAALPYRFVFTP